MPHMEDPPTINATLGNPGHFLQPSSNHGDGVKNVTVTSGCRGRSPMPTHSLTIETEKHRIGGVIPFWLRMRLGRTPRAKSAAILRDSQTAGTSVVCPAKESVGKSVKHATWPWRVASSYYHGSRLEGDLHDCRSSPSGAVVPFQGLDHLTPQGDAEGDGRMRLRVWRFSAGRTLSP
jgi:hypothetical protein